MDSQLEKTYERLVLYMVTASKLLYTQRWKNTEISTMEDWIVKMVEFLEIAKLTSLISKAK